MIKLCSMLVMRFGQDVRGSLRGRLIPGFTSLAVLSLRRRIGARTTLFSFVNMRRFHPPDMRLLMAIAFLCSPVTFAQTAEPTVREIENAYRSKMGEVRTIIPGLRWEGWRLKEVRGWSLKFKRLIQTREMSILTRRYKAVAKKNDNCAEYQIIEMIPFPPISPQIKPSLSVDQSGVNSCP